MILTIPTKGGECFSVHGVGVASSVQVGTSSVDGVVDGESSLVVEHSLGATTVNDAAVRADEHEVGDSHVSKGYTERVDPEVVFLDRVTESQVTSNTLFVAEHAKYSESLSEPLLAAATLILGRVIGDGLIMTHQRDRNREYRVGLCRLLAQVVQLTRGGGGYSPWGT